MYYLNAWYAVKCSLALRNRDELTESCKTIFPNKDVTVHELNNTAMNERMLEIKALNLIISLLYMLIITLVKPLSYSCSLNDWCSGNAPARPPHGTFNKINLFKTH